MTRNRRLICQKDCLFAMLKEEKPILRFRGKTLQEWREWRRSFRRTLVGLLGKTPAPVPLRPQILERQDMGDYLREKVVFNSEKYASVPAYVLVPKGLKRGERRPGLLCAHGHGRGKADVCGIARDRKEYDVYVKPLNYDYARQFAQRGYVCIAPDWRCFGERAPDPRWVRPGRDGCNVNYLAFGYFGFHMLALQIWDGMRTLDYLGSRPEVDPQRLGCLGLSFGGTMTTYLSALDPRIKVADIIGYISTIREDALTDRGLGNTCGSQYMPGLLQYGDIADVASLIAPRPLLVEIGDQDRCFILKDALKAYRDIGRVYRACGHPERLDSDVFPGGHSFAANKAFAWFDRWLWGR